MCLILVPRGISHGINLSHFGSKNMFHFGSTMLNCLVDCSIAWPTASPAVPRVCAWPAAWPDAWPALHGKAAWPAAWPTMPGQRFPVSIDWPAMPCQRCLASAAWPTLQTYCGFKQRKLDLLWVQATQARPIVGSSNAS